MQLTIRATGLNADVLSYLLAKNPQNVYERAHNGHKVRMFFSRFEKEEVDVTFFVTPDPIELSRNRSEQYDITSYINDREFAVSSIFCTLLRSALGTALNGKPKEEYQDWVTHRFSFQFRFGPLASHLTDQQIHNLFEPLGYDVGIHYGETNYVQPLKSKSSARFITLTGETTLQTGLRQLFVLIPVLDNYKHYYIDEKEIEKLERYGEGWLEIHPEREFILRQALRFKDVYKMMEKPRPVEPEGSHDSKKIRLNDRRYEKIVKRVEELEKKQTIVDFGSGEGKLSALLANISGVREIQAVEPSQLAMNKAIKRFEKLSQQPGFVTPTPTLGSLFYYDERLRNKDVMILCEVIEHIDEHRLPRIMETILSEYKPNVLLVTTPNREYNQVYDLGEEYRHPDHRFEWTRNEFNHWCHEFNKQGDYDWTMEGIGEEHETFGYPTQLAIFTRKGNMI